MGLIKKILIMCLMCFFMGFGHNVLGYEWELGKVGEFKMQGYLESFIGVRTQDHLVSFPGRPDKPIREAWDLSNFRNTLQLKWEYDTLNDHLNICGIFRFANEASYDVQHDVNRWPAEFERAQPELRELYGVLALGDFVIKAGKQQLVWGEADVLRMADVINPLDLTWNWSNESWENIRRPLRMIVLTYSPKALLNWQASFEGVYIPEDFKPTSLPRPGSNWTPYLDIGIGSWESWDFMRRGYIAGIPKNNNDEYGGRIRWVMGDWEFSIFDWYGRLDGGVVTSPSDFLKGLNYYLGVPGSKRSDLDFVDYPKFNSTGITFNWSERKYTKTVWRFEGAYNFDEPFNDSQFYIRKWDSIAFMAGFDRPTWIRLLNKEQTWFISYQWFHKNILDYKKHLGVTTASMSSDRYQNLMTLIMSTNYKNNIYSPTIGFAYDLSGTWFLLPSFSYRYNNYLTFTLGTYIYLSPTRRDSVWGSVRNNDMIYLRIHLGFS